MTDIPSELRYSKTHEWVRLEEDGNITVGITEHAQSLLGDLVFVDLPEAGQAAQGSEEIAVLESVKAAADVYAPISGEIIAVNEALAEEPQQINQDAFGDGWLFQLRPDDAAEIDQLLDADGYRELVEAEDH